MKRWTRKWEQVLGNDLKRHFEEIEYEFEMFKSYNEARAFQSPSGLFELLPIPENVPSEYLELAARFNKVQHIMWKDPRSMAVYNMYNDAAARLSGGAGP
ncbi:hypothetical protein SeLEV6574_g07087 [Synchytrium endobioticum]|uniref:Uncharacterized protein n=1 Tax=Synchytrium endobioticum TaxID=286115 RepID=A0A507CM61_9FUNG|nr:hypothetical protein SeLEV6574_g07087 [Synchytrium endobioticum]